MIVNPYDVEAKSLLEYAVDIISSFWLAPVSALEDARSIQLSSSLNLVAWSNGLSDHC